MSKGKSLSKQAPRRTQQAPRDGWRQWLYVPDPAETIAESAHPSYEVCQVTGAKPLPRTWTTVC